MKKLFTLISIAILLTSCGQRGRRSGHNDFRANAYHFCSEQSYAQGCSNSISYGMLDRRQLRSFYCERDYQMCLSRFNINRF